MVSLQSAPTFVPHLEGDAVERARSLAPVIRELAPAIERDRSLPSELVETFRREGFFHLTVPKEYGGLGLDPITAARVVDELATADGSTGWCVMISTQSNFFSGFMAPEHAIEVWGHGGIAAGTARPIGRARVDGDEAVVSGRWPFASGSSHADWFGAECKVFDGDEPRMDANGEQVTRMLMVPRDQVALHDTWDTIGLCGTASNDFSIDGAVVPWGRGFQMLVDQPVHPSASFKALPLLFINHGTHALGVARNALQAAKEVATTKIGYGGTRPLRETPRMQLAAAEAAALINSASAYLYDSSTELWQTLESGQESTQEQRAAVRLATSHAVKASMQAVDVLYASLGTASIFTSCAIERPFRDIRAASAHVMIGPLTYEAAGRVELGLAPEFPFF